MHLELLARWAFATSLMLPVIAFVAGSAAGVLSARLARVMVGFWIPSLISSVVAIVALRHTEATIFRELLVANGTLYAAITIPKLVFGHRRRSEASRSDEATRGEGSAGRGKCIPALVNQGDGGTALPFHETHVSGRVGWYFSVANYYDCRLDLDITTTSNSATGTASASGLFSPWYSLAHTARNATARATGNIICEASDASCEADAAGAQDQCTDGDYTAAVVVSGSSSGAKAILHVDVAAAVAGQIALSSINAGFKGSGGGGVGVTFNIPNNATAGKKASRSYTYRCSAT